MDPYAYNDPSDDEEDVMEEDEEEEEEEEEEDEEEQEEEDEEEQEEEEPTTYAAPSYIPEKKPRAGMNEEEEDDDDDAEIAPHYVLQPIQPRGKPEAMTANIMRAKAESARQKMDNEDSEEDEELVAAAAAVAEPTKPPAKKPPTKKAAASTKDRKKPATKATQKQAAIKKKAPQAKLKSAPRARSDSVDVENLMDQPTEPISNEQYKNLDSLMEQFCRVPLLAEFSRPVKLLHPELNAAYKKIVSHPVDLGHVCRGIRRRAYQNTRDVRLDMWRVFANCVKFHSHPNNRDKVPSFVSIALHLREYFNSLWQEYMLPSEIPADGSDALRQAIRKRAEERKKRLDNSGVLMMSKKFLIRVSRLVEQFIDNGGRTDVLDKDAILAGKCEEDREVKEVRRNLEKLKTDLKEMSERQEEYSIDDFNRRLQDCYSKHGVLEDNPALKNRFRNRLDRLVGKLTVPLHEANSRGVTQSSIWGNIATTIWARESGKKPYWPALCLGILPPEDQREGWHAAVTERNEARLPQKLRAQLMGAKKKCEAAQKRQSLSYFLVEFLGTHEFIWVRETDIVEKFDPKEDPNKALSGKSKKRASRSAVSSVVGSKTYATALEECEWATDEFEQVLQEAFDYEPDKEVGEDDGEFMNYSYAVLNQSDEEAEAEDPHRFSYDESVMSLSDVEEANWLLSHEGKIDTSTDARKQAKKRAQALKKKKAEEKQKKEVEILTQKKEKKKQLDAKAKEREAAKELKELDKRRKKRTRERDKQLKADMKKSKKKRAAGPNPEADRDIRGLGYDNKRARATAITKAFVHRMAQKEKYKNLYLGGSSAIPLSTVESSGLLSMALAFRVAAGELDDSDGTNIKPLERAWENIDTETQKAHQDRTAKLEVKVKLLEKEVERLRTNTRRRKGLLHKELARKAQEEEMIREDDRTARVNIFLPQKAKKKNPQAKPGGKTLEKPATASSSSQAAASSPQSQHQNDSNSEDPSRPDQDDIEDDVTEVDEDDANESLSQHEDAGRQDDEGDDDDEDDDDEDDDEGDDGTEHNAGFSTPGSADDSD